MTGPVIKTPRGAILYTKGGSARLVWNTSKFVSGGRSQKSVGGKKLASGSVVGGNFSSGGSWASRFNDAQKFVDSEVLRLSEKYIPLLTGTLIKSGVLGTDIGSGLVQWIAPYAKYQYYSPRSPGSQTGPLRGPYWFERMKSERGEEIISKAKKIAGGG